MWAAGVAADEHLTRGGWRPKVALPSAGEFDSGWPNLHGARLFAADDAPTDHSALFGPTKDQLKPYAYNDIPELADLIAYVRQRADLKARVSIPTANDRDDIADRFFEYEVADLALSLLDRARATGVATDDTLLPLYLERERAWLDEQLPVEFIVPLALTALDLEHTLDIGPTTRLEPIDPATQLARAPDNYALANVPDPVIGAATHALVITGHHLVNPGPGPRLLDRTPERLPLDEAELVCEALRVISHTPVGYAQVLRRPVGWADRWTHDLPAITTVTTVRRYPDTFDDYGWLRKKSPIPADAIAKLPAIVTALQGAAPNVRLAARRLSQSTLRPSDEDRIIDACIGLEALLGDGRDELSHRLALRAATALGTRPKDPADAHTIYDLTKKVYSQRSAVVHGSPHDRWRQFTYRDNTHNTATIAVVLLRELVTDVLTRRGGWTPATLDAQLLHSLVPPLEPRASTEDESHN